jgi:hypothetical protein
MAGVPNHHKHTYSKSVTYNDKAASASLARQKKKGTKIWGASSYNKVLDQTNSKFNYLGTVKNYKHPLYHE